MIREIKDNEIKQCVSVIRQSFQTVADEFGFTQENAPRFTAFATDEAKVLMWKNEQHRPMFGYFEDEVLVGYYYRGIFILAYLSPNAPCSSPAV